MSPKPVNYLGLTPFEHTILVDTLRGRTVAYNGRAMSQIERLVELGVVTADFDLLGIGSGRPGHWRITVEPVDLGWHWLADGQPCACLEAEHDGLERVALVHHNVQTGA